MLSAFFALLFMARRADRKMAGSHGADLANQTDTSKVNDTSKVTDTSKATDRSNVTVAPNVTDAVVVDPDDNGG